MEQTSSNGDHSDAPASILGNVQLDWTPQPGNYLDLQGKTYAILERRHRYQLKSGATACIKLPMSVRSTTSGEKVL